LDKIKILKLLFVQNSKFCYKKSEDFLPVDVFKQLWRVIVLHLAATINWNTYICSEKYLEYRRKNISIQTTRD